MKIKKRFVCSNCGYTTPSWLGKCPECLSWNSFIEEFVEKHTKKSDNDDHILLRMSDIKDSAYKVIKSNSNEFNTFFGEGLTCGAVYLLAGEPGIGKSTFLLLLLKELEKNIKTIYFSGEEMPSQIKKRALRVGLSKENLYISNITNIENLIAEIKKNKPDLIFIDSIQTMYSSTIDSGRGTISQIRKCTELLTQCAKELNIPMVIVGHVTKSGEIAGPKVMEHIVDVVIYFDTDIRQEFQILRTTKNRYGSTDEILFLEMTNKGLKIINEPTNILLSDTINENFMGKSKTVIMEGKRFLVVEVEALVIPSIYAYPKRFSEGVDSAKINRITAIIDKHVGENLSNYDIYFNISGGIKTKDPAIDLAIAAAIYSSKNKKNIPNNQSFIGELSLTGQIKKVKKSELRIRELEKYGVETIYCNNQNVLNLTQKTKIIQSSIISDTIQNIFF